MAAGPIVPNYTSNVASVVRKYRDPSPLLSRELSRSTPDAISAARRYDQQRLERGQRGLTAPQTALGLRAASTGESSIGEPEQGIVGDFVKNVTQFASGLPRLPVALGNEILDLPKAPEQISEGVRTADNPVEALGNIAQAPGARLVPGAFVASQFGTGGPGVQGLADNPLFTALDVLPYASRAARAVPAVKAAEAAVDAAGTGERVGRFSTALRYKAAPRSTPIAPDVNAVRGATVRNALEPSRIGRVMESGGAKLRGTRVGSKVSEAFGAGPMEASQLEARLAAELNDPRYALTDADRALIETRLTASELGQQLDPSRAAQIHRALRFGDDIDGLTTTEARYVDAYKAGVDEVLRQNLDEGRLAEVTFTTPEGRTVTEVVTPQAARRITKARAARDAAQVAVDALESTRGKTTFTPDELTSRVTSIADAPMSAVKKRRVANAYLRSARAQGFDVPDSIPTRATELDSFLRSYRASTPTPRATPQAIRQSLMSLAKTDPMVSRLVGLIDNESFIPAAGLARRIGRRKTFTGGMEWGQISDDLAARGMAQRAGKALEVERPEKMLRLAEKRVATAETGGASGADIPARFSDVAGRKVADILTEQKIPDLQAEGLLTPAEAADAAAAISLGLLDDATIPAALKPVVRQTQREVARTWLDMVDEGLDPTFVHRVSASRVGAPVRVSGRPMAISHVKERVFDYGNTVNDVMVALDHQAMELLTRRGHERFMGEMAERFGRDWDDLARDYSEWAAIAENRNPRLNRRAHLEGLIRRNWRPVDVPAIGDLPPRRVYLPRDIASSIADLNPSTAGVLSKLFDPVMNVFRTALLPLSPRWQVYNFTGGAIMATAEGGLSMWKHLPEALRIARGQGDDLARVRGLPQMAAGKLGREIREGIQFGRKMDLSSKSGRAVAAWEFGTGRMLRRVYDQARKAGGKVIDRSYAANEFVDDTYRIMAYLHGFDKAVTKGMTREAAEAAGVRMARRTLQSWDRMTPIERTVVRSVFPFYSWAKHLLGFVSRFSFDHPWRTSITASLVQAELDDYGTGLPQMFFSLIDITGPAGRLGIEPEGEGERIMLNMSGMNPFRDVASYATFLGFMASPLTGEDASVGDISAVTSQMNPAAQLFLRMVGVDPSEGLPDPYANVSYDPASGGLRMDNPFNPLTDPIQAILPQTKVAFDLAGVNRDYQQLVQANPDAARRRLESSLGFPALFRGNFDPGVETIKTETRRYEDMMRTRSEALRTGNLSLLDRYPALHPLRDQLRDLDRRGELDAVRPDKEDIERRISALNG